MHFGFNFKFNIYVIYSMSLKMCTLASQGKIKVKAKDLNLDLTLLGGQSFRWEKQINGHECEWRGVAYGVYWILKQKENCLFYKVHTSNTFHNEENNDKSFYSKLLQRYLRLDFDLSTQIELWRKSHPHFGKLAPHMKAVRVLDQEPLENIISFMCSQNNNIKRISTMIQWLCKSYGENIGNFQSSDVYSFPSLESLVKDQNTLESRLRSAKFGYRAKFIAQSIAKINEFGGITWFERLRSLPYQEARQELVKLPGIGFKVADCISLMSLGHLQSVPIDTHIFKIAQSVYMPRLSGVKAVTPKIYEEIAEHFREVYGPFAGWTQAVLFCSELQQFQNKNEENSSSPTKKKRNKKTATYQRRTHTNTK
ncbi:N-glycosylase/DNA lyase isoform X2 [Lucilia cuprina]|uniref:N-glycosylase/DNA lyase isoform X2 n=1 Tax=Lucilia cuprina TaxID=7375 RepID=UPI001F06C7EA|nr:N-glycosylase/DNA lyase isoform X2 [Lucilia cuprina]